jgi:RimJ/RimL family protein N-acetyltransferase
MAVKNKIKIKSYKNDIILNTIGKKDIELLRKWKNENRKYFFYNKIINAHEQVKWYDSYLKKAEDYIFLVEYEGSRVGCIGFRLIDDNIDIYNVILGNKEFGGRGIMGKALRLLCSYIIDNYNKEITLKVLIENKARLWYMKKGFMDVSREDNHIFMKLNINKFEYLKYNLEVN